MLATRLLARVEELTHETGLNEMNELNAVKINELVIGEMSGDVGIFEAEPEPECILFRRKT